MSICSLRPKRYSWSEKCLGTGFSKAFQAVLKLRTTSLSADVNESYLDSLLIPRLLDPTYRVSESLDLGWDPRICISKISSGETITAGLGSHTLINSDLNY